MKKVAIFFVFVLTHAALSELMSVSALAEESSDEAPTLENPSPSWYTPALHQRVVASGLQGVEVPLRAQEEATELNCLGYSPPSVSTAGVSVNAVSAGGCMVYPHGCTMNFIFRDNSSNYIGTAGHCVDKGQVVMQVASRVDPTDAVFVTLAAIGRVAKRVNQGIGKDFGLVKIDPGWRVVPGVAGGAGPTGVLCIDPLGQPVAHYGHGYVFFVEQGNPKFGEVIPDLHPVIRFTSTDTGFNWVGYGLPGDSGSGVMNDAGLAVGDLTHGLGVA
ncbi:MAG: hypothetical protein ACRD1T_08315, partial [Acidimicrobiia bacterium]